MGKNKKLAILMTLFLFFYTAGFLKGADEGTPALSPLRFVNLLS